MALSEQQQVLEFIKRYEKILLLIGENPNGDSLGSVLGLYLILKKLGKELTLVCPSPELRGLELFEFLPGKSEITSEISRSRDFVLSIANSEVKIDRLRYENTPERLNIFITPKQGELKKEDILIESLPPKYELVIVLDCPDLEQLGKFYEKNAKLFFETPILNIDHHSSNEHFGRVNFIDSTAGSCSEMIFNLISPLGENLLDENSSTCLLTGLITKTQNFQNQNTTPKSFKIAASLISHGARQQEIIRYLYKTKPLKILKLWGRVLANLEEDRILNIIISTLSGNDFRETLTVPEDLFLISEEIKKSHWQGDLILLLFEDLEGPTIKAMLQVLKNFNPSELSALFENSRLEGEFIEFETPAQTLKEAKEKILEKIRTLRYT